MKKKIMIIGGIIIVAVLAYLVIDKLTEKKETREIFQINLRETGSVDSCSMNIDYNNYSAEIKYTNGANAVLTIKEQK